MLELQAKFKFTPNDAYWAHALMSNLCWLDPRQPERAMTGHAVGMRVFVSRMLARRPSQSPSKFAAQQRCTSGQGWPDRHASSACRRCRVLGQPSPHILKTSALPLGSSPAFPSYQPKATLGCCTKPLTTGNQKACWQAVGVKTCPATGHRQAGLRLSAIHGCTTVPLVTYKVWPWDLTRVVTTHLARGSLRSMRSMASPTVAAPVQSCSRQAWAQEQGQAQQAAYHCLSGPECLHVHA